MPDPRKGLARDRGVIFPCESSWFPQFVGPEDIVKNTFLPSPYLAEILRSRHHLSLHMSLKHSRVYNIFPPTGVFFFRNRRENYRMLQKKRIL